MDEIMRRICRESNRVARRATRQLIEVRRSLPMLRARLGKDQKGATMVEYAILVALISVAAITIIVTLGNQINDAFMAVATEMGKINGINTP